MKQSLNTKKNIQYTGITKKVDTKRRDEFTIDCVLGKGKNWPFILTLTLPLLDYS